MNFINTFKRPLARLVLVGFIVSILPSCSWYRSGEYALKPGTRSIPAAVGFGIGAVVASALASVAVVAAGGIFMIHIIVGILAHSPLALPATFYAALTSGFGLAWLGGFCAYKSGEKAIGEYEEVRKQSLSDRNLQFDH